MSKKLLLSIKVGKLYTFRRSKQLSPSKHIFFITKIEGSNIYCYDIRKPEETLLYYPKHIISSWEEKKDEDEN